MLEMGDTAAEARELAQQARLRLKSTVLRVPVFRNRNQLERPMLYCCPKPIWLSNCPILPLRRPRIAQGQSRNGDGTILRHLAAECQT